MVKNLSEDDLFQIYRQQMPGLHDRIENDRTTGMPDVFSVTYYKYFFLELKSTLAVAADTVAIRSSQVSWIAMRSNFGKEVYRLPVYLLTTQGFLYNANKIVNAMQEKGIYKFFSRDDKYYRVPLLNLDQQYWSSWDEIRKELGAVSDNTGEKSND